MLTRREFQIGMISASAGTLCKTARAEQTQIVSVRIRADQTIRAIIPPLAQQKLTIERDDSGEAKELIEQVPAGRAVPIIFIIVGAMALPVVLEMMREALRQTYYGGVVLDLRTQPPTITSNPKLPANTVFVIDPLGKTTPYTSDQLSPEVLGPLFKVK
jgi:hypothetical protein